MPADPHCTWTWFKRRNMKIYLYASNPDRLTRPIIRQRRPREGGPVASTERENVETKFNSASTCWSYGTPSPWPHTNVLAVNASRYPVPTGINFMSFEARPIWWAFRGVAGGWYCVAHPKRFFFCQFNQQICPFVWTGIADSPAKFLQLLGILTKKIKVFIIFGSQYCTVGLSRDGTALIPLVGWCSRVCVTTSPLGLTSNSVCMSCNLAKNVKCIPNLTNGDELDFWVSAGFSTFLLK